MSATGKFVWRTLMTRDGAKAESFYRELAGWKIAQEQMGEHEYRVCSAGENPAADIVQAPDPNIPPHWMAYLAVDDLDATIERAQSLGATVMMGATEIPTIGRFAVLQDPQGAFFWPFQGATEGDGPPDEWAGQHGNWGWAELMTTDIEAARAFYGELIGYETRIDNMGTGPYALFKIGGHDRAGGMNIPEGVEMPPAWISYLTVDDIAAAVDRAQSAGGQALTEVFDIPGIGKLATIMDPTGAVFSIAEWNMPQS